MDNLADYDAWKSKQQQSTAASAGIVLETINVQPDETAGDMQLANEYAKATGKPVPPLSLVTENRSIFQQQIESKKNATLLSSSPMLAEWLRKPDNAALARDDLDSLSWFEGFGRGAANAGKRAAQRIGQAGNQFMLEQTAGRANDRSKSFGDLLEGERDTISTSQGDQKAWVNLSDLVSASGRYIDARYADLIGADDATAAEQFAGNLKASREALAAIPKSQIATSFEKEAMVDGAGLGDAFANFSKAFASNPLGGLSWALETAGESAPQIAAALAATVATRNPGVGIGVLGAGSYATERFTSPAEFLDEKGIDLGKPEDVQRLIADPTLMKDAADRGVIRGSIIGAFDMFSGGIAGRTLAGNPFVEALAQGVTQMIFGSSGEYAARLAAGQEIDWNEILAEGFAELATTPVDMGIAGRKFTSDRRAAKQAEARETEIKELAGGATGSVLRGRMPDAFRDFVARATANGPVENMYVPADQFIEYFQGAGVDPFALADELDGVNADDLRTALATGGDLQIPTATYAAKMAGSDHDAFLIENARFTPDEMTAREAREFNERAEDAMQEAFEEAERMRQDDEQYRSFEALIYDDMVSRLRVAGRSTDVATSEAMLYPAFYRVMAERSGLTTEEFLARYPLPQVRGDVPQGLQLKNVDALTRTLAEARAQKSVAVDRRQSLLEFIADYGGISDRGGELRARDAEVIDRGRGKKKLRLARKSLTDGMKSLFGADGGKKHGPDDVALAAIEAGFMADQPAVMAYKEALATGGQVPDIGAALWEAIDAELGGLQNFSIDQAKPAEPDADADQIEQYLSSLGVSLDDADDAIRAAIEADQAVEVRRYGQFAGSRADGLDRAGLMRAQDMQDARASRDDIYDATGFFVGPDGRWRFEISDADAKIRMGFIDKLRGKMAAPSGNLSDVLDHPKLFGAYPKLANYWTSMTIDPAMKDRGGSFENAVNRIEVRGRSVEEALSILLHEVAHAVQNIEGFATGGSPNMGEVYDGEKVKAHQSRIDQLVKDWEAFADSNDDARLDEISVAIEDEKRRLVNAARFEHYRRIAGEVEARNVQTRDVLRRRGDDVDAPWWTSDVPADKVIIVRTDEPGEAFKAMSVAAPDAGYAQSGDVRGNRGSVQFPLAGVGNGDSVISLFKSADLSTFIHESGHYFLTVMQDLAARGELASGADYAAVKSWWLSNADAVAKDAMRVMPDVKIAPEDVVSALENGSTGDLMKDAAVDVGLQEQWARAFEAYLLEGKAPSIELRGAFEKFRAWLLSIYKKLAGLNVTPSDDLRAVFDRMLATDEQIAAARQQSADSAPVFATAEEMGLSPEDYAAFLKLRDQSIDEAHAKLLAETMAPIKREREKWYREERAKVRDEVELDVSAQRVYRAIEWMGNRRWFGDAAPEPMGDIRLSKDILVDRYGAGVLKTLPRGKQTVYSVEGGLDPDDAAGVFGFGSGDEMVKALEQAPPRKQAIEGQTDRVMFERHGDVLRDGTVEAAALDAVHGDKRAQALALELKALVEVSGSDRGLTHKEAREIARQTLSRAKVRDAVNANRYLAAERKAGEEAERLASSVTRTGMWMTAARRRVAVKARAAVRAENASGVAAVPPQIERANDTTGRYNENAAKLVEAKRRQLLNHALYSEARRVADEVEAAEKLVAKLEKATKKIRSGRKRMGEASLAGDYVEAIEAIIYGYEFRKVSGAKVDRRAGLLAYVERMTADGRANELAIPQSVLDDARVVNYRSLPVEHLRGVVDSLKNIEHTARMKGQMLINKRKREFEEATADVARAIGENVKGQPIHWVKDDRATTKAREFVSGYISTLQSSTTILRQLDGREDMGVVYETLKSDMDAAAYAERDMRKEATDKILDLYSVYSEDEQRRMAVRMVIPELGGQSFSKWNLIAMALNMGNEGNLARLTNKNALMHLTPDQVDAVKGLLDARDAKFVQSVWDYINSFRPKIAERDRRIRGVEPTWVDPAPVEIAGMTLRGGYYPIKYEGRLGGALFSSGDSDADILNSMMSSGFSSAQTKNGHLKARGEHIKQSLALDVSVIAQHANEVIHDLAFSEPVVNTWRILTNGKVEQAMIGAGLDAQYKMLKLWVQDAASGQVSSGSGLARSVQFVRSGFTYSKLALNLKTILLQPLGLMQSAVVVGKKNLAYQTMRYVQNPAAMTNDVLARSRMMWERRQTFNKDLMDAVAQSNIASPTAGKIRTAMDDYIIPFGMAGITYTQFYVVDVPTWAAAFQKGMKQFKNDEVKAAHFADMTVQRSQGSGIWSDRSGIERGTLSQTMRQNPFVTLLTTLGSYFFAKMNLIVERTQGLRAEPVSVGAATSYALDMALLLAGEAAALALVKEAFDDDDGDDDDNIAATIAMEAAKTFVAGLPVVRDVAGLSQGFQAGTYASILDTVWAPLKQAGQGEVDKALVKSVVNLTGMLTRLPSSQTNRIIDGAWRELEGDDVSVIEYLMGRSKK